MKYFILYGNCVPVKGYKHSLICDLQRNEFTHIPTDLFNVLENLKSKSIKKSIFSFPDEDKKTVLEYFDWLVKNDFGFFSDNLKDLERFSPINTSWNSPFEITNIVIYINTKTINHIDKIVTDINALNINHCELFIENEILMEGVLKTLDITTLRNIKVNIINPVSNYDKNKYEEFCHKHYRISSITVFNSKTELTQELIFHEMVNLIYTPQTFSVNGCGVVSKHYFNSNLKNFTESLNHNSCLNQKISIDIDGNIRNCPSMKESFGNIKDTSLKEALEKREFKKYWDITKDKISVCKNCEFRHICTDCRAYTEDPNNIYSKPLKCGYNPYTATWEEWSTNPLKQKAIAYYSMQKLIK